MKLPYENETLFTRKSALPIFTKGGTKAVLLLHGYNGYPDDWRYQAEKLSEAGLTVFAPRLPGHGTSSADFLSVTADMWVRTAIDAYLDMKCDHETVGVCGLSMGGLLAIIVSSLFNPEKIALLAPALENRDALTRYTPFLKHFLKKHPREWDGRNKGPDDDYLADEYWKWYYIPQIAEFTKVQALAKKRLSHVRSDILTIVSKADRMIPPEVASMVNARAASKRKETVMLENSMHVITRGCDKEMVTGRLIAWFA